MREAERAYNDFLAKASKTIVDVGAFTGDRYGFGYLDSKYDADLEDLRHLLDRATVKFHELVRARQVRIRAMVEAEERKAAAAWQRAVGLTICAFRKG